MAKSLGQSQMRSAALGRQFGAMRCAAVILLLIAAKNTSAAYVFQKVVDTSTAIPGGVGMFTAFDETAYDGNYVSFRARGAGGQEGVYLWDGAALSAVADANAMAPNGGGQFDDFLALSLDAGHVAFVASGTLKDGVYTTLGGALRRVADTSMTMPSSVVPFNNFTFSGDVAISGANIVFSGSGANASGANAGVYRESGGVLARVADRTTAIPEFNDSFLFFSAVDASGGEALFAGGRGTGGGNGFYTTSGAGAGQVRAVVNADRTIPGLSNPINIFSPNSIRIEGSDIAFSASDSVGGLGVYLDRGGVIETIADRNTVDPVTGAAFSAFATDYSLSAGAVAFRGSSTGPAGLYVHKNGMIRNVIHANSILDSKAVLALGLYGESLSGGKIAFRAAFVDGTSGIYIATPFSGGPNAQEAAFLPLFDARSIDSDVVEGQPQISVQTQGEHEMRACMEFDLSQLPSAAQIQSATLRINVSAIALSGQGGPSLTAYGYAGDGALDSSDVEHTDVVLGQTTTAIDLGALEIELDATSLQALIPSSGLLGLVLRASAAEHVVSFDALEQVGGAPMELIVEYSLAPGDFNGDGHVDSQDLAKWKSNFGHLSAAFSQGDADGDEDVDGSDFLIWQRGQAASATIVVADVPEPASWQLLLATTGGVIVCRRIASRARYR